MWKHVHNGVVTVVTIFGLPLVAVASTAGVTEGILGHFIEEEAHRSNFLDFFCVIVSFIDWLSLRPFLFNSPLAVHVKDVKTTVVTPLTIFIPLVAVALTAEEICRVVLWSLLLFSVIFAKVQWQ